MENPEEGPRPPQHFIRHVVERSGPHENISEAERRERLTNFVNNQDRPLDDPARVYALWHLNEDYPQAGGRKKRRKTRRKTRKHKKKHRRRKSAHKHKKRRRKRRTKRRRTKRRRTKRR